MDDPELDKGLGRRSQIGGGLAAFIGVLLLLFTPAVPPGTPVDPHKLGMILIAVGVLSIAVGTWARRYYLD
jgi:hypothetical protein